MGSDYLTHYGILGMKWGVRRFQNKDGTLTEEGKRRYRKDYMRDAQRTSTQIGRTMITRKRQLAADKSDLEKLNSGKHLSVGFTKKRQEAYDKRDKAVLERRIKYNEQYLNKERYHEDYKRAHTSKSIKSMSDAELRNRLNRLQMERQYSQLSKSSVSKGREFVQNIVKAGTTVAAVTTSAITIYNNIGKIKDIIEKRG